jgi:hypothetical protein
VLALATLRGMGKITRIANVNFIFYSIFAKNVIAYTKGYFLEQSSHTVSTNQ